MSFSRVLLWTVAGAGIVVGSFFATLPVIDYYLPDLNGPARRNAVRAEDGKAIRAAIEKYKAARGSFPVFREVSVDDLKSALVGGGYISAIPQDPLQKATGQDYRYGSIDGTAYAVWIRLEQPKGSSPALSPCLVGMRGYGYYSDPPLCPF